MPADGNALAEGGVGTLLVRVTDESGAYGLGDTLTGADQGITAIKVPVLFATDAIALSPTIGTFGP